MTRAGATARRWALALALLGAGVALGLWLWARRRERAVDAPFPMVEVHLDAVSNASGLTLVERDGELLVATVDEVDEWEGGEERPPLVTLSAMDGRPVGGEGRVASFGEVEALAVRDGVIAFPYKTGAQRVVLRWGDKELPLIDAPQIAQLNAAAAAVSRGPFYHEFEGLEWFEGGWQLIDAVVAPDVRDTPASTRCVMRLWFDAGGRLLRVSPPLRRLDGRLATDYAAALAVLPGDLALIPGFKVPGVRTWDAEGRLVADLALPVVRVEGIAYDAPSQRLFMVRECVGEGLDCVHEVAFGVPLWIATVPLAALAGR